MTCEACEHLATAVPIRSPGELTRTLEQDYDDLVCGRPANAEFAEPHIADAQSADV